MYKPIRQLLTPLLGRDPASQLIRQTARQQWQLIGLNLGSSLMEAITEGATLSVVFLAVEILSRPADAAFDWSGTALASWLPSVASILSNLPPSILFVSLLLFAVLLQAIQSLSRFLNQFSIGCFSARCRSLITGKVHDQVLSFSFPCSSAYKVGDLLDYAVQGPEAIRIQIEQTGQVLVLLLLSAMYLGVLLAISPWLLLVAVLMGGGITLLQKRLVPRIRAGSILLSSAQVDITSRITEDFQGLRLLHTSGQLDASIRKLAGSMKELECQLRLQARRMAIVGPFASFLPILAVASVASFSVLLLSGKSSGVLPSLVTFVLALQRLNVRFSGLAGCFNNLADNSGRFKRLNEILLPAGKQFRRVGGIPFVALGSGIQFDSVELRYSSDLPCALKDISFVLPKGSTLALVGPSGAGKSSISDLLSGLYAPTHGRILIDGVDLNRLDLASWQQRLGVVSQDTFLFNATIAENIAFGLPNARLSQIKAACQAAQAAGFIELLPDGYDTLIGERGYRLSGGQRQRLSLARAILRDPELLILDEATSALDSQSERLVQEAIERFEHNHTVLVIAHRLSTIVRADQILVLEGGRVVQRGRHSSLLGEAGLYQQLWQQQSQAGQPALT